MKKHLSASNQTDTWITPKYITDALGNFDLDPCAHTEMPWHHAYSNYTVNDNGLSKEWEGRVWLNPPFSAKLRAAFMEKMSKHKNGIMLIPAGTETDAFKKFVWDLAIAICFLDHRPYFRLPNGEKGTSNSGQSVCLVAYDEENALSLLKCNLGIVLRITPSVAV